jgi:hypothetical protein
MDSFQSIVGGGFEIHGRKKLMMPSLENINQIRTNDDGDVVPGDGRQRAVTALATAIAMNNRRR